jgi:hypothetical protein
MDEETGRKILAEQQSIKDSERRMMELAGFTSTGYNVHRLQRPVAARQRAVLA